MTHREALKQVRSASEALDSMNRDLFLDALNYTAQGEQTAQRASDLALQAEMVLPLLISTG